MKTALVVISGSLAIGAFGANAQQKVFEGPYFGEVVRIVDGDNFIARVDIWPTIKSEVSIRIRGIDAPEIFRPSCEQERYLGDRAKAALSDELPVGQIVRLEDVHSDAFAGRVIASVFRQNEVRGTPIDEQMIRSEYVARWVPGDAERDWCVEDVILE